MKGKIFGLLNISKIKVAPIGQNITNQSKMSVFGLKSFNLTKENNIFCTKF
jgi:hypothetical protein